MHSFAQLQLVQVEFQLALHLLLQSLMPVAFPFVWIGYVRAKGALTAIDVFTTVGQILCDELVIHEVLVLLLLQSLFMNSLLGQLGVVILPMF